MRRLLAGLGRRGDGAQLGAHRAVGLAHLLDGFLAGESDSVGAKSFLFAVALLLGARSRCRHLPVEPLFLGGVLAVDADAVGAEALLGLQRGIAMAACPATATRDAHLDGADALDHGLQLLVPADEPVDLGNGLVHAAAAHPCLEFIPGGGVFFEQLR